MPEYARGLHWPMQDLALSEIRETYFNIDDVTKYPPEKWKIHLEK
jgi:hypothetical protein